ncbi:zinc-binding dehydrogenase [Streptomyces sp. NPDC046557]|uniref:zinc-binding dehydrogenase n=1 Tax=Streptomyces sp. NPDC046557 TaxID=3155372 RepID=UPI0033D0F388
MCGTGPDRTALRARADALGLGLVELSFTPSGEDLATLDTIVDQDLLRVSLARTYPLERVAEAHAAGESGHTRGEIVVSVGHGTDSEDDTDIHPLS